MYLYPNLAKPFIDWANTNVEIFTRFANSPEIAELTRTNLENFWKVTQDNVARVTQSGVYAGWTKANLENFSRLAQDYSRALSEVASETQAEMAKGIQEATSRFQQVAKVASDSVNASAREATRAAGAAVEEAVKAAGASTQEVRRRA
jgi:hypothetical protein